MELGGGHETTRSYQGAWEELEDDCKENEQQVQ